MTVEQIPLPPSAQEDELPVSITPELVLTGLGVLGILFLLLIGFVWWGWRRLRRSRQLERGKLVLRAATTPGGLRKECAELRLRLQDQLGHTERVLRDLAASGAAPERLLHLLHRLQDAGREMDTQLRMLGDEPTEEFLSRELPPLRTRVERVSGDAQALRRTALRFGNEVDGSARAELEQDLADEIAGLEAGLDEVRTLQRPQRRQPPAGTGP